MAAVDEAAGRLSEMPTWMLSQASNRAHRLLTDGLASVGARGYDYRVLVALHELGPSSQATIGRRAQMDRSDVVAAVDTLVAQGYATRSRDPSDLRRNVVAITVPGSRYYRRLDRIILGVQDELLDRLDPSERRLFLGLLRRLVDS